MGRGGVRGRRVGDEVRGRRVGDGVRGRRVGCGVGMVAHCTSSWLSMAVIRTCVYVEVYAIRFFLQCKLQEIQLGSTRDRWKSFK